MSDDFEADYMAAGAAVRHRDKRISRAMVALLSLPSFISWATAIFVAFMNSRSDRPLPPEMLPWVVGGLAVFGAAYAVMALAFAVLRTIVTDDQVIVKYGLWGPEIDLEAITACKVVDYDWKKFGGWGLRKGRGNSWAYVPGPGEVVEIVYTEGDTTKTVQVGATDARSLSLAINRAREQSQRLRIDAELGDSERELEQDEQEVAAEQEHAEHERALAEERSRNERSQ